jgi:hypothetical protein
MGLFDKLFGGGKGSDSRAAGTKEAEPVEYKGFKIHPTAQPQNGQWLTAGVIRKEIDGEVKEHCFLRADTHASAEAANDFAVIKGRQIIDEQGERIFDG